MAFMGWRAWGRTSGLDFCSVSLTEPAVPGGYRTPGHITVAAGTVVGIRYPIPSTANNSGAVIEATLGDI